MGRVQIPLPLLKNLEKSTFFGVIFFEVIKKVIKSHQTLRKGELPGDAFSKVLYIF